MTILTDGFGFFSLLPQLKAIEELKEKHKRGERLEATQLKKMDGEAEIRKELKALGDPAA
jgi:translation initiation factor 2A